jgi:hypothetical protein
VELYDHQSDPQENQNLSADPKNRELVQQLHRQMDGGWKAARPGAARN